MPSVPRPDRLEQSDAQVRLAIVMFPARPGEDQDQKVGVVSRMSLWPVTATSIGKVT